MKQKQGKKYALITAQAGDTTFPTGDVGVNIDSVFSGVLKPAKYIVTVAVTGTGSCIGALAARDFDLDTIGQDGDEAGAWGFLGDNDGKLNQGAALAAGSTYHFTVIDLGYFRDVAFHVTGSTGSPVIDAVISEVLEGPTSRGD